MFSIFLRNEKVTSCLDFVLISISSWGALSSFFATMEDFTPLNVSVAFCAHPNFAQSRSTDTYDKSRL